MCNSFKLILPANRFKNGPPLEISIFFVYCMIDKWIALHINRSSSRLAMPK